MFGSSFRVALAGLLTLTVSAPADFTEAAPESFSDSIGIKFGCKCAPTDPCWPSASSWNTLNAAVGGKLIEALPPAIVCYPGPLQDPAACATVVTQLTNSTYVADNPIALDYPIENACPASNIPAGGVCSLGDSPRYTVNATSPADVQAGVNFARTKGIRLVVRNTGHDILGRSTGYGSLQIWIRHLRQGIVFQSTYTPSKSCSSSTWSGSAFVVKGGYVWSDVYAEAAKKNVIVVGGGDPTVGCIGGWAQGGGHSPANHDYGLGADQILEARVVLANGNLVTASPCENTDLFFAIRGGGGGTYGIVVSITIKAYPNTMVAAQVFAMAPLTDAKIPEFMEALAILYSAYPDINDSGFNGYGNWAVQSYAPVAVGSTSTTGYNHAFAVFGKTIAQAQSLYASTAAQLAKYNGTSLFMKTSYYEFSSYQAYYSTLSGGQGQVGTNAALGSRLLDRAALKSSGLKNMLNTTAGSLYEFTSSNVCLTGGGQVFRDATDTNSGVLPGWRKAYVHNIVARGWAPGTSEADQAAVHNDVTNVKTKAMEAIAPTTGAYMNEGDRKDPNFLINFYGSNVSKLQAIKGKYDATSLFYCPTCIGSNEWYEDSTGRLCRV